ncbi:MAG: sensor histidine kinase [Solirubrobacteraceae bacterium]
MAIILTVAMGAAFFAVERETGSGVKAQIDHDLATDAAVLGRQLTASASSGPAAVEAATRRYLSGQPSFGSSARLYVVDVRGGPTITNEPELLGFAARTGIDHDGPPAQGIEQTQANALLTAPPGRHVLPLVDAGPVRLLVTPLEVGERPVARVEVGESWSAVARARESVGHAFLVVGVLALLAAIAAADLVARWIWRPVRLIAATAERIDAGDLDHRINARGLTDEIGRLAAAFDHMLERLKRSFAHERDFVADASHELRTPLTVISGQIELLALSGLSDEEDGRSVELVQLEIARMKRLIEDMLLLATSDRGPSTETRSFAVAPFLRELLAGVQPSADRRFELSLGAQGTLEADADRIAQVIRNLIRNAIEHTAAGGLIRLTAQARGRRLELAIEDDGPGIPLAERERIFDRFHRTDGSRSRSQGGSGLGLAIARAIVLGRSGRTWADQSPEGGARIAFELSSFVATSATALNPEVWKSSPADPRVGESDHQRSLLDR